MNALKTGIVLVLIFILVIAVAFLVIQLARLNLTSPNEWIGGQHSTEFKNLKKKIEDQMKTFGSVEKLKERLDLSKLNELDSKHINGKLGMIVDEFNRRGIHGNIAERMRYVQGQPIKGNNNFQIDRKAAVQWSVNLTVRLTELEDRVVNELQQYINGILLEKNGIKRNESWLNTSKNISGYIGIINENLKKVGNDYNLKKLANFINQYEFVITDNNYEEINKGNTIKTAYLLVFVRPDVQSMQLIKVTDIVSKKKYIFNNGEVSSENPIFAKNLDFSNQYNLKVDFGIIDNFMYDVLVIRKDNQQVKMGWKDINLATDQTIYIINIGKGNIATVGDENQQKEKNDAVAIDNQQLPSIVNEDAQRLANEEAEKERERQRLAAEEVEAQRREQEAARQAAEKEKQRQRLNVEIAEAARKAAEAAEAARKAAEDQRREQERIAAEAQRREQERIAAEARRKAAADEAQRLADEARCLADEARRKAAADEARRLDDEARRKAAADEARRKAAADEARRLDDEARRKAAADEAQRLADEARRKAAADEAQRLADEARRKAAVDEAERLLRLRRLATKNKEKITSTLSSAADPIPKTMVVSLFSNLSNNNESVEVANDIADAESAAEASVYTPTWNKLRAVVYSDYPIEQVDKIKFVVLHRIKTLYPHIYSQVQKLQVVNKKLADKIGNYAEQKLLEKLLNEFLDEKNITPLSFSHHSAIQRFMKLLTLTAAASVYHKLITREEINQIEQVFGQIVRSL